MPDTTNGLTYPSPSAAPNVPADIQTLATDIDSAAYGGIWADYTPTITGFTNVTITSAKWRRIAGKSIAVEFLLTLSGTPAAGILAMTLPVSAGSTAFDRQAIGTALMRDASVGDTTLRSATCVLSSASTVEFYVDSLTSSAWVTQAVPWTWAVSDTVGGTFHYREA